MTKISSRVNSKDPKFGKHTLSFAEHMCRSLSYYIDLYQELIEREIYKFTSKTINTKINLYRASDVTAETALRLAENSNKEIRQVGEMIRAVQKVFNLKLTREERLWAFTNLVLEETKIKLTLEDKRKRNYVLSLICVEMGFPEKVNYTGLNGKRKDRTEETTREELGVVKVSNRD